MSTQELQIVINAKDRTDEAFKSVGKAAKVAFAAATAAVASFGVIAKNMVSDYIKDQKDMALANGILEKTLSSMNQKQLESATGYINVASALSEILIPSMKEASEAALNLGYDDEAASIGFAKLYQVTGDVAQAQKDLKLAMDLSAFSGKTLEESVSAVTRIHAGGTKILKDFGIEVEEGTTAMDALAIANEKVGGTAEKMSQTIEVQMQVIKNRFANFKSDLGGSIIKAIFGTDDEAVAMDKFKEKVGKVFEFLEANKDIIATVLVAPFKILNDVLKGVVDGFQFVVDKLNQLYVFLEDIGAIQLFKDIWESISKTFNETLKPALQELWAALEPFKPYLEALATVFGAMLLGAIIIIAKILQYLAIVVINVLTTITKFATFLSNVFKVVLDSIGDAIVWVISKFKELIDWVERALNKIGQVGKSVGGIFGGGKKKSVNDAVIGPDGDIITTHPDDYIIATKNPSSLFGGSGGNVIVNMNGGTYLDSGVAEDIGNMILEQLQFNMRGS